MTLRALFTIGTGIRDHICMSSVFIIIVRSSMTASASYAAVLIFAKGF
jgi:hypothetical protein